MINFLVFFIQLIKLKSSNITATSNKRTFTSFNSYIQDPNEIIDVEDDEDQIEDDYLTKDTQGVTQALSEYLHEIEVCYNNRMALRKRKNKEVGCKELSSNNEIIEVEDDEEIKKDVLTVPKPIEFFEDTQALSEYLNEIEQGYTDKETLSQSNNEILSLLESSVEKADFAHLESCDKNEMQNCIDFSGDDNDHRLLPVTKDKEELSCIEVSDDSSIEDSEDDLDCSEYNNNLNENKNYSYLTSNRSTPVDSQKQASSNQTKQQRSVNTKTEKPTTSSDFCFLLVEALKNICYYRFNLSKILQSINCNIFDQSRKVIAPPIKLQKRVLFYFVKYTLEFICNKEESINTDSAIFNCDNVIELKANRKCLINRDIDYRTEDTLCGINKYKLVKNYNENFTKYVKVVLRNTKFNVIRNFSNEFLSKNFLIYRYYDLFTCMMPSLYNISEYFDIHLKGKFEKHLFSPPAQTKDFYGDYTKIKTNTIFYWAIDWLYFFSNHCVLPVKSFEKKNALFCIYKYPQEFFIQFLILIHIAINYKEDSTDLKELDDNQIRQLKENIKTLLYTKDPKELYTFYTKTLMAIFTAIDHIYSYKVYNNSKQQSNHLMRTTEENIENVNRIDLCVSVLVFDLYTLLYAASKI